MFVKRQRSFPALRPRWFLAVAALFVGPASILGYGCGDDTPAEPDIEDLCGWLSDPNNCYREFAEDIGDRCGVAGLGNAPLGSFLARDKLDICILSEGGQVLFDPPLDVAMFPPDSVGVTFVNSDGSICGKADYNGPYNYSVTVEPDVVPDGGSAEGLVVGGTFSQRTQTDREILDVTCPGPVEEERETHFFDRLQVTKCREYEPILPRAEIEINAGGITPINGFVRMRVFYPPTDGELANAQASVVEYFECAIPGAPEPCFNGVQDGGETDVDCGGNEELCPSRCEDGQLCLQTTDCQAGLVCGFDLGIKLCMESGAGGAGGGG